MATIKSFSDLQQSHKLAEILPLESADMNYYYNSDFDELEPIPNIIEENYHFALFPKDVGCWSLSALLDVLPNGTDIIVKEEADTENEKYMCTVGIKYDIISTFGNNPVDACVAMVLKLNELKML